MSETLSIDALRPFFRFPFEGEGWQGRFLVGAVLVLAGYFIPILPLIFVAGYALIVMRQTLAGRSPQLPAWDDWGELTTDGLKVMAVNLAYMAPAIVVFLVGMGLYFAGTFYMPFAAATSTDPNDMLLTFPLVMLGSMAVMFLSMALGTLFMFLGAVAIPMATAHFAAEGRLGAAFRLRQWLRILRADKLGYLIAWVVVAGLGAILYFFAMLAYATFILCFLIPFILAPATFYIMLVGSALFGHTYRHSAARLPSEEVLPEPAGEEAQST
jgi:hypothetical protein